MRFFLTLGEAPLLVYLREIGQYLRLFEIIFWQSPPIWYRIEDEIKNHLRNRKDLQLGDLPWVAQRWDWNWSHNWVWMAKHRNRRLRVLGAHRIRCRDQVPWAFWDYLGLRRIHSRGDQRNRKRDSLKPWQVEQGSGGRLRERSLLTAKQRPAFGRVFTVARFGHPESGNSFSEKSCLQDWRSMWDSLS